MTKQIPLDPKDRADTAHEGGVHEVAPDLGYERLAIVNVVYYGAPGSGSDKWVLIDAGLVGTAGMIGRATARRFGEDSRPAAIVMTHGHFDHVGALEELAEKWDVPVYAHEMELPYLDGRLSYPPPDPTVGGGMLAAMSTFYPRGPINIGSRLMTLPADGSVPGMPGWRWIPTPGHSPGHVSLWRESDRTIIAGDAFVTTRQESIYAAARQEPEMHGPPMYYTPDWESAKESVKQLAALEPELAVTGHGRAMKGAHMRSALHSLADNFDAIAVPEHGRYVHHPTREVNRRSP
ncbi:MAG TPA: MBL fold metallo-hydrolase [Gemmatimonadaceae bacterium]|jgi:glyoxylase-like metal-dependent hydrolase (beta-lactamase superfamily II)